MFSDKFICSSKEKNSYKKAVAAPYFRKEFELPIIPDRCILNICGLGFYECFINGKKITKGILAPYISNPNHIVYYDSYDLTPYLVDGKNVMGVILGNGMQNAPGGELWRFEKASFNGVPKLAFSIEYDSVIIEADETVKTALSPIIFDDLRSGCHYDARKEIDGWCEISFDDSDWKNSIKAVSPKGEKKLAECESVVLKEPLSPVSVYPCKLAEYTNAHECVTKDTFDLPSKAKEGYLYDFGVNTAGIVRLKIKGQKGQQIDLQFGEYINENGELDYNNINFYPENFAQRDVYICKGEGEEVFEPFFTYHGFRYCLVLGITPQQATEKLLTLIKTSSALEERGGFCCSDETANLLQKMVRNSDLSNFCYFPTDCPHREKNAWTGDAVLSAEQLTLNFGTEKSFAEWMKNVVKSQNSKGVITPVVPADYWSSELGPAWDAVLTELPYIIWKYRGETKIIEESADAIYKYIKYLDTKRTPQGLIDFGLGDWCHVTTVKAPIEFTSSTIALDILKKASLMFGIVGYNEEQKYADKLYNEIRHSIRANLIDFEAMTVIGNCQTSQAMAIFYDVFDDSEKKTAFNVLHEIIKKNNNHIDFGILGARVLFRVLSDFGESDLAYEMITRKDFPSYGHFIEQGLTALPESFLKDNQAPNSLNHHFFGDISAWFISHIAGIRVNPYNRNPAELLIKPCFIEKLSFAEGFYNTVNGTAFVRWERMGKNIKLVVNLPEDICAELILPDGWMLEEKENLINGSYTKVLYPLN